MKRNETEPEDSDSPPAPARRPLVRPAPRTPRPSADDLTPSRGFISVASPPGGRRTASPEPASTPGLPTAVVVASRGELPEHLFRRLLGAYLGGAREFVVRERPSLRAPTRDVIRTFCRRTRQPEIVSDEGNALRLHDLAYENPIPFEHRIARMGRLVVDFHREAVESWSRLPFGEDEAWERRDDEIDREAWYLQRLVAVRIASGQGGPELLGFLTIGRSLERIADHAVVLGEAGRRLIDLPQGSGPTVSLRQFHDQAMEHLEGVLTASDGTVANDLLDMGEALLASGHSLSDRLLPAVNGGTMPPATAAAVARILESIGRTIAYAQDIGQVALDGSLPADDEPDFRPPPRRVTASQVA
jgi:hypothetical protein